MPHLLRGFNLLKAVAPSVGGRRSLWLGLSLGTLLAAVYLAWSQDGLQALQARERQQQARLAQLQQAQREAQAQARRHQALLQALEDQRAAQDRHLRWLAILEDLAAAPSARLSQLRLDDQALVLHGQLPAGALRAWAQARATPATGLRAPELLEMSAPTETGASAERVHFVLRWPHGAGQVRP